MDTSQRKAGPGKEVESPAERPLPWEGGWRPKPKARDAFRFQGCVDSLRDIIDLETNLVALGTMFDKQLCV